VAHAYGEYARWIRAHGSGEPIEILRELRESYLDDGT
jgi:hypothetical protein